MIYQVDAQLSVPEPFGLAGRFYWTWTTYYDCPNDAQAGTRALADTSNIAAGCTTPTVLYDGYRVTKPPRSGTIIFNSLNKGFPGHRPSGTLIPIHNVMRVRNWSGSKLVGWHYWRGGFLTSDVEGFEWNETVRHSIEAVMQTRLTTGQACGLHGEILTDITVDKAVAMLNLRHGTKRLARKVLT